MCHHILQYKKERDLPTQPKALAKETKFVLIMWNMLNVSFLNKCFSSTVTILLSTVTLVSFFLIVLCAGEIKGKIVLFFPYCTLGLHNRLRKTVLHWDQRESIAHLGKYSTLGIVGITCDS